MLAAQGDLGFDVDIVVGIDDLSRKLGTNARHTAKFTRRRRQHGPRSAESFQERLSGARPHAGNQRQPHRIDQIILQAVAFGTFRLAHENYLACFSRCAACS